MTESVFARKTKYSLNMIYEVKYKYKKIKPLIQIKIWINRFNRIFR